MFTHPKKKINQNKVILTATIIQSQHCRSCQKRFMSTAVVSHEVAFFTKMSHKLLSATALGVCANIIPCGSVFFGFFFLTVILDERRCLPGCQRPQGLGSQSRQPLSNIQHVSYRFSKWPGFISLPLNHFYKKLQGCVTESLYQLKQASQISNTKCPTSPPYVTSSTLRTLL